jgi:hypothetical protein
MSWFVFLFIYLYLSISKNLWYEAESGRLVVDFELCSSAGIGGCFCALLISWVSMTVGIFGTSTVAAAAAL